MRTGAIAPRRRVPAVITAITCATLLCGGAPAQEAAPRKPRDVRFGVDTRLGGDTGDLQSEPAIAVNPLDPGHLVAGFIDYSARGQKFGVRFVSTTDGGVSWSASAPAPGQRARNISADPSFAADLSGNTYYAYIEFRVAGQNADADILVAKSTDGGRTFPTFTVAAPHDGTNSLDKPYMGIDAWPGSPFRETIYVAYMDFLQGVMAVVSRDAGATWSAPALVAPFDPVQFSQSPLPVVAPDGAAYIFYAQFESFREPRVTSIRFVRSMDGGRTWSAPASVASGLPSPGEFVLKNADPDFGSRLGAGVRAFSFPAAAITPNGDIFVAWIDFPAGSCTYLGGSPSPCVNADLRLSVSRDGGASWSAPLKVTDDAGTGDQFFPWMAAHPDGLISISWIDRRLDPRNVDYDIFYTNTYDGKTFLPNVRVNTLPSLLGTLFFIGDYQGMVATADAVLPVWNDARSGSPAIFFARGTLSP